MLGRRPLRSGPGSGTIATAAPGAGRIEADAEYACRLLNEQRHFDDCLNVHELPDIFHYWSNRYLRPMFEPFGFSSPNDFFLQFIRRRCEQNEARDISIVSIGAGNCDLEIELGEQLLAAGLGNFRIDCVEINGNMLDRARARVGESLLTPKLRFLRQDLNRWRPGREAYDVIMANQSLHHVLELFVPYGNVVFVFIDRPFGHNFDAGAEWDRGFIDRIHAADEAALLSGRLKPTAMLAALRLEPVATALRNPLLTPRFCVRPAASVP